MNVDATPTGLGTEDEDANRGYRKIWAGWDTV